MIKNTAKLPYSAIVRRMRNLHCLYMIYCNRPFCNKLIGVVALKRIVEVFVRNAIKWVAFYIKYPSIYKILTYVSYFI